MDRATCLDAQPFIDAWKARDIDALVAMSRPLETRCPVPRPAGLGGPYPLCDDATVDGEVRHGYVWSSGTHGGLDGAGRLQADLERLLATKSPVVSIGCEVTPGSSACAGDFSLILGPYSLGEEARAVSEMAILRDTSGGSAGLVGVLLILGGPCSATATDGYCSLVNGGTTSGRLYRYWGDESHAPRPAPEWTFFRWSP